MRERRGLSVHEREVATWLGARIGKPEADIAPVSAEAVVEPSSATAFAKTMSSVTGPKTAAAKTAQKNPELAPVAAFTGGTGRTRADGMLAGSILSPATWKQLATVFRQGR